MGWIIRSAILLGWFRNTIVSYRWRLAVLAIESDNVGSNLAISYLLVLCISCLCWAAKVTHNVTLSGQGGYYAGIRSGTYQ